VPLNKPLNEPQTHGEIPHCIDRHDKAVRPASVPAALHGRWHWQLLAKIAMF
jgi:hypothetical protein